MPYNISWYQPKRIVLVEFVGDFDGVSLKQVTDDLNGYLREGEQPIHVISNLERMNSFPKSVSEVRNAVKGLEPIAIDVFIGMNSPIVRFVASVISKLTRFEVRVADDLDEAAKILHRLDPTLEENASVKTVNP